MNFDRRLMNQDPSDSDDGLIDCLITFHIHFAAVN